jgi:hypothetical protein
MEVELEGRDDADVAGCTPDRPEQVRLVPLARRHELPVR